MRDLPSLKSLRSFEAAARNGSFTEAANELCVGQGAVSHQIKTLEAYLGLKVFLRKQDGVELTREGELLFAACRRAFDDLGGVVRLIKPRRVQRTLRVKVGPFFSTKLITPRISEFLAANAGVQLHLSHPDTNFPAFGEADVLIDYRDGTPAGRFSTPLLRERLVAVCAPSTRQRFGDVRELLCRSRLHYRGVSEWQNWIASSGLGLLPCQQDLFFDDEHIILEAVKEGQGVALVDRMLAGSELDAGQILLVGDHFYEPPESYQFVCQEELIRSNPTVRNFLDWLLREIKTRISSMKKHEHLDSLTRV